MKYAMSVISLCSLVLGISGCDQIGKVTSHFGHGRYYCYYYNEQTNASFQGVSGDEAKAQSIAKDACVEAGHQGGKQCYLADCVFK